MGQEISGSTFSQEAHAEFRARLRNETKTLKRWFDERLFDYSDGFTGGLEVEAWLIDENALPSPRNQEFISAANHPLIVPELSQFNFEINSDPLAMSGDFLKQTREGLEGIWSRCRRVGESLNLRPALAGIFPTVRDEMLQPAWMSLSNRYKALNDELFHLRGNEPLHIDIQGDDHLDYRCNHLMLEAACTSLQVHLKINQEEAVRFYNASVIASGPLVACAANAPFLYGKSLWAETRIAAFEQATNVIGARDVEGRNMKRVTLGSGYLRHSFLELFLENLDGYSTLLPALEGESSRLPHLRLQNGTVWRWNRPIVGFDGDGKPHLRIEQRVMPAGPTIADMVANIALYFGLAISMARSATPPEADTPFEDARANFYACARDGLNARVRWAGTEIDVQALLLDRLIPDAKAALANIGLVQADLDYYFDEILHRRLMTGVNGARWQRSFMRVNGHNFQALAERYVTLQETGVPVHEWAV